MEKKQLEKIKFLSTTKKGKMVKSKLMHFRAAGVERTPQILEVMGLDPRQVQGFFISILSVLFS